MAANRLEPRPIDLANPKRDFIGLEYALQRSLNRVSVKLTPAYWTVDRLGAKLTEILRTEGYDVSSRIEEVVRGATVDPAAPGGIYEFYGSHPDEARWFARAMGGVTAAMVATMKEGAVIVDVAVDQGGCVETVHPTTLLDPVYVVSGVVHYGVANMPAQVPRTSTFALTNATLPYVLELAARGVAGAARANGALAKGINVARGRVVHPAVAASLGEAPAPLESVLG